MATKQVLQTKAGKKGIIANKAKTPATKGSAGATMTKDKPVAPSPKPGNKAINGAVKTAGRKAGKC